jgi:hypothetical protein
MAQGASHGLFSWPLVVKNAQGHPLNWFIMVSAAVFGMVVFMRWFLGGRRFER